eukprot:gnl/TRDRNA2_/TRDRNA2_145240_c0_seq1.p1 gnl/TRDRNA2_/TRDRNA2_145240_c0~~gnl/TRDRNA2_/TRDRNA2_145240_c0_seq1.p1  ORF type:complete len:129 (+),score=30.97 gnl/TRDRNA2_/TRDRNA2_145240_c0_seq1:48-434(+)
MAPRTQKRLAALEVIAGMAETGDENAIKAVTGRLQDKVANVRGMAVEVLAMIADHGDDRVIQALQVALKDEHQQVRRAAQQALDRLLGKATDERVRARHLADEIIFVRCAAAEVFQRWAHTPPADESA